MNINEFTKNMKQVCENNKFILIPYTEADRKFEQLNLAELKRITQGFTSCILNHNSPTMIFYDDSCDNKLLQRFIMLHELGHAFMNDWNSSSQPCIGEIKRDEFLADIYACVMTALITFSEFKK